jgi:hypothetical protein
MRTIFSLENPIFFHFCPPKSLRTVQESFLLWHVAPIRQHISAPQALVARLVAGPRGRGFNRRERRPGGKTESRNRISNMVFAELRLHELQHLAPELLTPQAPATTQFL